MRRLIVLALFVCAACADPHALPETHSRDPTWQLNKGRWELGVSDLTAPADAPAAPAGQMVRQPVSQQSTVP